MVYNMNYIPNNSYQTNYVSQVSNSGLYTEFLQGTAKVRYRGSSDGGTTSMVSDVLQNGGKYTVYEIAQAIVTENSDSQFTLNPDIKSQVIDCGMDGVPELLVEVRFNERNIEEYVLHMIIKDIGGELVLCYDGVSWSRSNIVVNYDGTIEGDGSGGAVVHYYDYAFVDAYGNYHFYYGLEETYELYGDYNAYTVGENYTVIPVDGLDGDNIGIKDYYFEPNFENRINYYSYFYTDDNYKDSNDSQLLKKKFESFGLNLYSQSEMDEILKKKALEIGYPR